MLLNFMGLDISTHTGASILQVNTENSEYKLVNCYEITAHSNNAYYSKLLRAEQIAIEVEKACWLNNVHFCLIENFAYANHFTLSLLTEITTLIKYKLRTLETPYLTIAPTSLKKFITGNGRATKSQMAKMCEMKYDFTRKTSTPVKINGEVVGQLKNLTDNIVDSYSLAMLLVEVYTRDIKVNDVSREAIVHLMEVGYNG